MKLIEITERLNAEFPGKAACFTAKCWSHLDGSPNFMMDLWIDNGSIAGARVLCDSFEGAIGKMKAKLNPVEIEL